MSLFSRSRKYTVINVKKRNIPEGIWSKCPECGNPTYVKAVQDNLNVCPYCEYHFTLNAKERINLLVDAGTFEERDAELRSADPLEFKGPKTYKEKLAQDHAKTKMNDAVITGRGKINGRETYFAVTDSRFIMGSMGSVVGERITRIVESATRARKPVVIVSGSGGGARMYEGLFSLMQMAKTCAALKKHHDAGQLYISILTDPTMGGVMASFAGVGDIIIAEPKALIGFAGPRVIEQTIRQKLPEGFQRSEFLLAHGLIDRIVKRKDMKETIAKFIDICSV
ncbi:MAG: acetyl-CoA carboxylase, carboxyltransferase subunit beta [Candidatus Omnitrophota bacterium]